MEDSDMAGALTVGTVVAPVVTLGGAVWAVCSLGGGWSGWPGQVGLRDAAAGRKRELVSERWGWGGEQRIPDRGTASLPEGPLDRELKAQPAS